MNCTHVSAAGLTSCSACLGSVLVAVLVFMVMQLAATLQEHKLFVWTAKKENIH